MRDVFIRREYEGQAFELVNSEVCGCSECAFDDDHDGCFAIGDECLGNTSTEPVVWIIAQK
jgi:hypothetical protein